MYEKNPGNGIHWNAAANPRLSYLASLQADEYQEEGSIRIEIDQTPYYIMLDRLDRESYSAFRSGGCSLLSYAIHQMTGLPIAAFDVDDCNERWGGHTAVQIAPEFFVDITGVFTEKELIDDFARGSFVNLLPARIVNDEDALSTVIAEEFFAEFAGDFPKAFMTELQWLVVEDFAKRVIRECIVPHYDKNHLENADDIRERLLLKDVQDELGEPLPSYQ